ncbi:MAG: SgcJ/EcaC family oxidoreductase [bacterium]
MTEDLNTIAQNNFSKWNAALATKDPKKVAQLYTKDATFLPTLSDAFEHGQSGAENYFIQFLQKNPVGVIRHAKVQHVTDDCYVYSGMYTFEVDDHGKRKDVEARFTFTYKRDEDDEWKIVHHHSSLKPCKT